MTNGVASFLFPRTNAVLTKIDCIGQGTQHKVYTYKATADLFETTAEQFLWKQVLPTVQNDDHLWVVAPSYIHSVKNILVQYAQCLEAGIPVARYANLDRYVQSVAFRAFGNNVNDPALLRYVKSTVDDGGYIVQNIPDPLPAFSTTSEPWIQLKELFRKAYDHKIPLDLQPDNVGLLNGKLYLRDLMEMNEVDNKNHNPFHPLVEKSLQSFTADPEVQAWLDPRPS